MHSFRSGSRWSAVLPSLVLLLSGLAALAQESNVDEFTRRREEIRERFRRAAEAGDLDGKSAALRELIALELRPGESGESSSGGSSGTSSGNSGNSGGSGEPGNPGTSNPGLGSGGGIRPSGTEVEADMNLFDALTSILETIRELTGGNADPKVDLVSLTFKSDHGMLKDQAADWTNSGTKFAEPEWTKAGNNFPISHTMDQSVEVELEVEASEAVSGKLVGKANGLEFSADVNLPEGKSKQKLTSTAKLPKKVGKFAYTLAWTLQRSSGNPLTLGSTGGHTVFATMNVPREEGRVEDGPTVKRMERAVTWIAEANSLDPHVIVDHLFGKYGMYVLGFNYLPKALQDRLARNPAEKTALEDAGFAAYMKNEVGGAWPLAQYQEFGGECQAIVRLIRGNLTQAGAPGKAEPKYVNADAANPYTARILDYGTKCPGPDASKRYALSDSPIAQGKAYDDTAGIGWNNYEAYLKFEHNGRIGWLGGGVGRLPDTQNPLNVFFGLAEYEGIWEDGTYKRKVTTLWDYTRHTWAPWQN